MHHLAGGVNAGVGAPGRLQPKILAAEPFHRRLDGTLHRGQSGLGLKAPIGSTIIFDDELVARHQRSVVPAGRGKPRRNSSAS